MHKHIAGLWIADLERNPPQARGVLFDGTGHCCLGRLCVLAGVKPKRNGARYKFNGSLTLLPPSVMKWAGMDGNNGSYDDDSKCLVQDNDDGQTFPEIAQTIRKHWETL